jgi:hypothetical protein
LTFELLLGYAFYGEISIDTDFGANLQKRLF